MNTFNLYAVARMSLYLFYFIFLSFFPVSAGTGDKQIRNNSHVEIDEVHPDKGKYLIIRKEKIKDIVIKGMEENIITVAGGTQYIVTHNTNFYKQDNKGGQIIIKSSSIKMPCVVDFTYNIYSNGTEENPFQKDQKVLTSVLVKRRQRE